VRSKDTFLSDRRQILNGNSDLEVNQKGQRDFQEMSGDVFKLAKPQESRQSDELRLVFMHEDGANSLASKFAGSACPRQPLCTNRK